MTSVALLAPPLTPFSSSLSHHHHHHHHSLSPLQFHPQNPRLRILYSSNRSQSLKTTEMDSRPEYQPGIFDDLFLNLF
ncbi:hypothetical protein CsSME_00040447 [Camellia sinensis var. sinensis]